MIVEDPILDEQPEDPQYSRWLKQSFEKVTGHIGRVFLCDMSKSCRTSTRAKKHVGTIGLIKDTGASLCALHTIYDSIQEPSRFKIHVVYPNYHQGKLEFDAKVKSIDEDVDMCLLEPAKPLTKAWTPLTCLDVATDAREGDFVYCFFYPIDPTNHETPELYEKIIKPEKPIRIWRAAASSSPLADHPTIISGNICFSEWMQGVATYRHLPDSHGGFLISRSGRVKGVHVKTFPCGELETFLHSNNCDELRIAKLLSKTMRAYAPSQALPVFVPPHGLVRMLHLQSASQLLEIAHLHNNTKLNVRKLVTSHLHSKTSVSKHPFDIKKTLSFKKRKMTR